MYTSRKGPVEKYAAFVVRHRWPVIIMMALFLVGMSYPMKNLYFNQSQEMWMLPDNPVLIGFEKLRQQFGENQYLLVGLSTEKVTETILTEEGFRGHRLFQQSRARVLASYSGMRKKCRKLPQKDRLSFPP